MRGQMMTEARAMTDAAATPVAATPVRMLPDAQTVTSVRHWTDRLFSFRVTRPQSRCGSGRANS